MGYVPLFDTLTTGTLHGRWPDIGLWPIVLCMADRYGDIDVTPDYIANLLALRHSIAVPPSRRPLTASPLTFLIALLAEVTDYSQAVEESWGWKAVKLLVELGEGLEWSMGQVGWGGELRRVGVEWLKQTQMK